MNCVPPSSSFGEDDSQGTGIAETSSAVESAPFSDDRGMASNYVHSGNISMMESPHDFASPGTALNANHGGPMAFVQANFNDYQYNGMNVPSLSAAQQTYLTQQRYQNVPNSGHAMRPDTNDNWTSEDKEPDLSDALHDLKINPVGVGLFEQFYSMSLN